jgi:site-specific DNA recombinase
LFAFGHLGNEIYCGRLVWNKIRMLKDPETGKRVSRPNSETEWHRKDVPHLQIITAEDFDEVARIRLKRRSLAPAIRRKPKRLLSGLLRCAVCGGGMSIKGKDRGGTRVICTQYHNSRTCTNNRTLYLKQIEKAVLSGLKVHLADPSAIRLFLETYYAERKRLIANANSIKLALERKIGELNRKIARLTEAMLESETPVTGFTAKLFELEDERRVTEAKLEELTAPQKAVALHPAARERYLQVLDDLAAAINVGKPAEEIVDAVRELIDSVVVEKTLPGEPIRLKVNGRLAALIGEPAFPEGSVGG